MLLIDVTINSFLHFPARTWRSDPLRQRRGREHGGARARHRSRTRLRGEGDTARVPAGQEREPHETVSVAVSGEEGEVTSQAT